MSEIAKPPSPLNPRDWKSDLIIRHITSKDLAALEWEGEYTHFRRVYNQVYNRMRHGLALMWAAEQRPMGIIGQAFVQFTQSSKITQPDVQDHAYVHSFRVKPKYRHKGIGTALMNTLEDDLIKRGFITVSLNVSRSNDYAGRFYARRGYTIQESVSGEWTYYDHKGVLKHQNEPGWRMFKQLSN